MSYLSYRLWKSTPKEGPRCRSTLAKLLPNMTLIKYWKCLTNIQGKIVFWRVLPFQHSVLCLLFVYSHLHQKCIPKAFWSAPCRAKNRDFVFLLFCISLLFDFFFIAISSLILALLLWVFCFSCLWRLFFVDLSTFFFAAFIFSSSPLFDFSEFSLVWPRTDLNHREPCMLEFSVRFFCFSLFLMLCFFLLTSMLTQHNNLALSKWEPGRRKKKEWEEKQPGKNKRNNQWIILEVLGDLTYKLFCVCVVFFFVFPLFFLCSFWLFLVSVCLHWKHSTVMMQKTLVGHKLKPSWEKCLSWWSTWLSDQNNWGMS